MNRILRGILAQKQREVEALRAGGIRGLKYKGPLPVRDFKGAITRPGGINLIAEIKFASPSAGVIRKKIDPRIIGKIYQAGGATAVSLLTDKRFFGGNLNYLPLLKGEVALPVLRKDFIIEEIQLRESLHYGADAVLLIAGILSERRLKALLRACQGLGLAALTEIHDRKDLEKALCCGAEIIGINNRNLETFEVDPGTTAQLVRCIPEGCVIVSESGINCRDDISALQNSGIHAVLVGTSIMKSGNMLNRVKELVGAGRREDGKG